MDDINVVTRKTQIELVSVCVGLPYSTFSALKPLNVDLINTADQSSGTTYIDCVHASRVPTNQSIHKRWSKGRDIEEMLAGLDTDSDKESAARQFVNRDNVVSV